MPAITNAQNRSVLTVISTYPHAFMPLPYQNIIVTSFSRKGPARGSLQGLALYFAPAPPGGTRDLVPYLEGRDARCDSVTRRPPTARDAATLAVPRTATPRQQGHGGPARQGGRDLAG